mmetsp:Transcript_17469/g.52760  ORF Transcript_17469/g.52760 Transcript_17469/m.52760 type:complete len:388 (+) Transcript_17469:269-1432(+)
MAQSSLFDRFQIDHSRRFGEGGYGVTFAALDRYPPEGGSPHAAVKVVDTHKVRITTIQTECRILEHLSHHNVISIRAHGFGSPGNGNEHLYYIFMECADGGELFEQVVKHKSNVMAEEVVRGYFSQLVEGVRYLHESGVAHCDLKLENVLLTTDATVKIIDFGLSHIYPRDANGRLDRSERLTRLVGSKSYIAPQVLLGEGYDGFEADLWSLGVCLFSMLAGFFPLAEAHPRDWRFPLLEAAQRKGSSSTRAIFAWYRRSCSYLSPAAVDLLDRMLTINPSQRAKLDDVRSHQWMMGISAPDQLATPVAAGWQLGLQAVTAEEVDFSGPVYRGSVNVSEDRLWQVLAEEGDSDEAVTAPIYRALGLAEGDTLPMPTLERQHGCSIAV